MNFRVLSRWLAVTLAVCFFFQDAHAQGTEPPTLSQLKLEFDIFRAELAKPIKELNTSYEEQLNRLLDTVTQAGKLEQALAVRDELETYQTASEDSESAPFPDLKRLQNIYAKAKLKRSRTMQEKLIPLAASHKTKLEALKKWLTQKKKLEEAVKVQSELKSLEELIAAASQSDAPAIGARTQFRVGSPSEALTTEEGSPALAKVTVSGAQWESLKVDAPTFSDADYKWSVVTEGMEDVRFSQLGKHTGVLEFAVEKDGLVFIAVTTRFSPSSGEGDGWEKEALDVKGLRRQGWRHLREFDDMAIEDAGKLMVFYKECLTGESYSIRTEKYIAPFLLTH